MSFIRKIGFTGTQEGMTAQQKLVLSIYLNQWGRSVQFHHGDCIGADAEAHEIAKTYGATIHIHPPSNASKRAWCKGDVTYPVRDYLDRNHDIVDAVEMVFATPKETEEQLRSGTWATIRYAKKKKKQLKVIYPDVQNT